MRDNGKIDAIEPAPIEHAAGAWDKYDGLVSRWLYAGSYYFGFGVMLPVWFMAHALAPADNALMRGLREGADDAIEGADRAVDRLHVLAGSIVDTASGVPAIASA